MRRTVLGVLALALVLTGVAAVGPVPASAATPTTPGSFVPLTTPVRVLHPRTVGHGATTTVSLGSAVPSTASAVVVSLTSTGSTANGVLRAYRYGSAAPGTYALVYAEGVTSTATAEVPVGQGRITVANSASSGSTQVVVDVQGYYVGGAVSCSVAGAFHAVAPSRAYDSSSAIGGGTVHTVSVGRTFGCSAGAVEADLVVSVVGATASGSLTVSASGSPASSIAAGYYPSGFGTSMFTRIDTDATRRVSVRINTSGKARVVVDVVGYSIEGPAATAGTAQELTRVRVVNGTTVNAHAVSSTTLAGHAGVPRTGVSAALISLAVSSPRATGGLMAGQYGHTTGGVRSLSFRAGQTIGATLLVPVDSAGRISVLNDSGGSTRLYVDVIGYIPTTSLSVPTTAATARYVRDLSPTDDSGNIALMQERGAADAAAGVTFALLDIGAQLNNGTGVQLSLTSTNLTYAHLVTAVDGYLAGFASGGHRGTVAVGTNNDAADWTHYTGTQRGTDWAVEVIKALEVPSGVAVKGADDIEPGFGTGKYSDAHAWTTAFLSVLPAGLVVNGSADGCPFDYSTATCMNGWTPAQLYGLASASGTTVLPQIYTPHQAAQWAAVDRAGGGKLVFVGSLTESDAGTLTPQQGWVALVRSLSSVTSPVPAVPLAVDLHSS